MEKPDKRPPILAVLGLVVAMLFGSVSMAPAQEREETPSCKTTLAFVGLHGGCFEQLKKFEKELDVRLEYLTDERIAREEVDFASFEMVFLQHIRGSAREAYQRLITSAKQGNPKLRIFDLSGHAKDSLPSLVKSGLIEHDPEISRYYGGSSENLRRLLVYVLVKYLGRPDTIEPPVEIDRRGIYHPDHEARFDTVRDFLRWAKDRGREVEKIPRVIVAVHLTHLLFQQPRVVDALIRELEKHGVLAVAMVDLNPEYSQRVLEFKPNVIIHTCHSNERVEFRKTAKAPHLHSLFFRKKSIDQWRTRNEGLDRLSFQVTPQEVIGAIEPQIGAGTLKGSGSEEAFTPIPERIEHLVARAVSWADLSRRENKNKKVAFFYWDREMGKAELMRGSATGMFMNGPRSLVNVLKRMREKGYAITAVPHDEDELVAWMMERGRQIGVWAPGVLDRLARSGQTVLVPAETYQTWFESKVPEKQREELIRRWGEPPGEFLVWEKEGEKFIVIPRIDLGNIVLLPQPLRGEAHDTSLLHDKLVPPPHNYLATYFWLQEEFGAHALVHFGTHGSDFMLPGRPHGLGPEDWTDMIMGRIPNIQPWVINNLGESSPSRRRSYAVLIDHLTPPLVDAELSDELLNLHNHIDKWVTLEAGLLKEKFRASISKQVRTENLDKDLHLDLEEERLVTPEEIMKVLEYLHDIHTDTTPVSLHVFGEPPRDDLLVPYLVTCLQKRFLDALGTVIDVPAEEALNPGDRQKYLRGKAEEAVTLFVRRNLNPTETIEAVGGQVPDKGLPEKVLEGFELAIKLTEAFGRTHEEIGNLLAALDGRFIPPGPGNSPDRNPAVVPTGRNMFIMNPEEVPSKPSWELGKILVDQLLQQELKSKGCYPRKIAFTLNSFATFQDYGVMESQILYLMGVRPVWDAHNLVVDVELIPAAKLGRPRIDVFISALGYYLDTLPTRMRFLDKAIRLVAALKEDNNLVFANSLRVRTELEKMGIAPEKAEPLSRARMFGRPPGQYGSAGYYYLVEKSGEWDSREELMNTYLEHSRHVYTEGLWGENAPETYNRHIQGAQAVLRTWADRTRSPLSNKYIWYKGGSLALAIKHLTGKEPEFYLSDVRDSDRARMVNAHDALRQDYRVRLFNRKWIEGMMKEGYAGADQVAVHISNTMGWKIMRENSVSDDIWEEIVDLYLRDQKNLNIREWFEAENPFAFQEITEILLETIRKGYWKADEATLLEIAAEYARSVARHGEGSGLRGGGNEKLDTFVDETLNAPGTKELNALFAKYRSKARETEDPASTHPRNAHPAETEIVEGKEMAPAEAPSEIPRTWPYVVAAAVLLLFFLGIWKRSGMPK